MYTEEQKKQFSQILENIGASLDIPESKYEQAVARYRSVGNWLDANDSTLHIHKPVIYPQGSFRLGTVVKPLNNRDEYDIDLVCHLEIDKRNVAQSDLIKMVGDRLRENEAYKKMLQPGRRCWTLDYANEFHMDILPAIPDYVTLNDSILITDKKLRSWQHSNPKGYARWFISRMQVAFTNRRMILAETMRKANVEEVPEYMVRTPLQRTVQILKRHRDIYFDGKDNEPISIIITTLAGHLYDNEEDLYEALTNIVHGMSQPQPLKGEHGEYYIPNPTNSKENFADKWKENPALPLAFFTWLGQLKADMETAIEQSDLSGLKEALGPIFGVGVVGTVIAKLEPVQAKSKTPPEVIFSSKPNNPWAR